MLRALHSSFHRRPKRSRRRHGRFCVRWISHPRRTRPLKRPCRCPQVAVIPSPLLHVVDRGGSGQSPVRRWIGAAEYDRTVTADALTKLRFMIPPPQRGAVEARVAIGEPATEILSVADALKPELLVIGAEARTRLGSRLFGKTAQLIRDSACPILAVPALKAARADDEKVTRLAA